VIQSDTNATGFGSWMTVISRGVRASTAGNVGQIPTEPIDATLATRVTGTPCHTSRTVCGDVLAASTTLSTPGRSFSQSS
jgi:hypothetical protein